MFLAPGRPLAEAMVVTDGLIAYVGDRASAERIAGPNHATIDLEAGLVLPGFVDGHAHILGTGQVHDQVDLVAVTEFAEIERRLKEWVAAHPDAPRVRANGWLHTSVSGRPTRQLLDAVVADRPVYVQAYDYHSIWLNSAALA